MYSHRDYDPFLGFVEVTGSFFLLFLMNTQKYLR